MTLSDRCKCADCGEEYVGGHICPVVLLAEARAGRPRMLVLSGSAADVQAANLQAIRDLAAERDRYRRALESIREHEGKVCDQYETCEHRACRSSYGAWSYADGALGCTDSLGFDEEEQT